LKKPPRFADNPTGRVNRLVTIAGCGGRGDGFGALRSLFRHCERSEAIHGAA